MRRSLLVLLFLLVVPNASAQAVFTLEDALAAVDDTLAFDAADVRVAQADEVRRQALALLRPSVSASGTYTLRNREVELEFGNPLAALVPYLEAVRSVAPDLPDPAVLSQPGEPQIVQYRHDLVGSISVDQSLFNARALPFIRQARIGIRSAENAAEVIRYELRGVVTQAYFAAVLQKRLVDVASRNAALAALAHDRAVAAFELGVGNRFEVNRAQVERSRADREVENAATRYAIARRNLVGLLERSDIDFDVVEPAPLDATLSVDTSGVGGRPDIVALELQREAQHERVAESRAQLWPNLFAHLQGNVQRETAFSGDRFSWFLQIGANWTLYDGGVRAAQRRQRERDLVLVDNEREQLLLQIEAAVDGLVLEIVSLQRTIDSAAADLTLAQENVDITDSALTLGVATAVDVQLAREQRFLAELALASAEVNLAARLHELRRIAGVEE